MLQEASPVGRLLAKLDNALILVLSKPMRHTLPVGVKGALRRPDQI